MDANTSFEILLARFRAGDYSLVPQLIAAFNARQSARGGAIFVKGWEVITT